MSSHFSWICFVNTTHFVKHAIDQYMSLVKSLLAICALLLAIYAILYCILIHRTSKNFDESLELTPPSLTIYILTKWYTSRGAYEWLFYLNDKRSTGNVSLSRIFVFREAVSVSTKLTTKQVKDRRPAGPAATPGILRHQNTHAWY